MVVTRSPGVGTRAGRETGSGSRPVSSRKAPGAESTASVPPRRRGGGTAAGTRGHDADKQRAALERLAEGVFARRGYRETTIREVAAHARCSVGQIYKLYPNKLALYRAVIESKVGILDSLARQILESRTPPEERLRRMVHLMLGFFQQHVTFFRIVAEEGRPLLARGNRGFLGCVGRWRVEILDRTTATIRLGQQDGVFRRELDPQLAAVSFYGLIKAHTGEWILNMDGKLVDRADAILDLFLAGVRRGRNR